MLIVTIDKKQYEYDIHSLVKAFYPEEDVTLVLEEDRNQGSSPYLEIQYGEAEIILLCHSRVDGQDRTDNIKLIKPEDKGSVRNQLKQLLYRVLSADTGKTLPWGTLTGIRPTKIPMGMLEENKSEEVILQTMKDIYAISEEKAKLSIDIAKREKEILSAIHYKEGYSVYIGIPFCPTTCLYCSFTSYPISVWKKQVDAYLDALEREIDYVATAFRDKILDSVYIGGGTPTTLEAEQLDRLLYKIRQSFDMTQVLEFTVEAGRADSITRDKLKVMQKHHVTRISVNPQTMKDATLCLIGRQASVTQVIDAYHMAREEGFTNINMDIILGLPEETKEDVMRTMEAIQRLRPDSLTVHSLAIKRASRMQEWIEQNGITTLRNTAETMQIAAKGATEMGMEPYYLYRQKNMSGNFENVGYATKGNYGIYNILIMEEKQSIMALGAGSISKAVFEGNRIERDDNVKDVGLYIERIDEMIERKRKLFEQA
ncbi:MAG: coproporphyrinogen dehydrogenase HemZ [Lachnospiraceae bacterium]